MSQYLSEAFKKLDFLNEDTFSVSNDGLEDFIKFEEEDEFEDSIDVIDTEAETIDDIQDSYVGKVILDCCVCHSKLYKDVEDVVIDGEIANADEECPFCYTTDGFKVVGQVAAFDEETEEKDDDDKVEETKDDEELEESFVSKKSKNKRVREFLPTPPMPNVGGLLEDEEKDLDEFMDANITLDARGFGGKDNNVSVLGGKIPFGKDKEIEEGIFDFGKKKAAKKEKEKQAKLAQQQANRDKIAKEQEKADREKGQRIAQGWKEREDRQKEAEKEYNTNRKNNIKGSKVSNTGKAGVHYSGGDYYTESKSIKESGGAGFRLDNRDILDIEDLADAVYRDDEEYIKKYVAKVNKDINVNDLSIAAENSDYPREVKYLIAHMKNKGYNTIGDFSKALGESKSIRESVNNVNVETDDDIITVNTDDNGKVTITTEPVETSIATEETIQPLEPEVQNEIDSNVADGGEIEIDMDEFDEESFDELGEGYLKKVYENVNSFKTSNVSFIKDKLILEGIINFTSGKSKKTNFVFGIREATKSGKIRFIGENKEIARGRKSFTITGRVENKKFLSESFNYNYGVRNSAGKAQRLYGTIKNSKRG